MRRPVAAMTLLAGLILACSNRVPDVWPDREGEDDGREA